jgi:hypothetical protein
MGIKLTILVLFMKDPVSGKRAFWEMKDFKDVVDKRTVP